MAEQLTYALAKKILTELDPSKPLDRGRLIAIRRNLPKGPMGNTSTHPLAKLIDERLAIPLPAPRSPAYVEPWNRHVQSFVPRRPGEKSEPLTPADLLWLQGLSDDPAKVTDEEAVRLAQLAQQAGRLSAAPSDRMLVEKAFAPVKEHRERLAECSRLVAQAGLTNHQAATGASVGGAPAPGLYENAAAHWGEVLGELVLDEVPELTETEARARARQDLRESWTRRDTEAQQARQAAASQLATPEMKRAAAELFAAESPAA